MPKIRRVEKMMRIKLLLDKNGNLLTQNAGMKIFIDAVSENMQAGLEYEIDAEFKDDFLRISKFTEIKKITASCGCRLEQHEIYITENGTSCWQHKELMEYGVNVERYEAEKQES
jgi:hypothetical protein